MTSDGRTNRERPRTAVLTGPRLLVAASLAVWWSPLAGGALALAALGVSAAPRLRRPSRTAECDPADDVAHLVLGTVEGSGERLVMSRSAAREHLWVHGSPRSGRRETLLHVLDQAMEAGTGWVHVDGTGDAALVTSVCEAARRRGLAGEVRVLNWLQRADRSRPSALGYNPFLDADAGRAVDLLVAAAAPDGDAAAWVAAALPLARALVHPLMARRDLTGAQPTASYLRMHLDLDALVRLSRATDVPEDASRPTREYLATLTGYDPDPSRTQPRVTRDDHAARRSRLALMLDALSDRAGAGHRTGPGTVNLGEALSSGQPLVVLLPPPGSPGDDARLLARLFVADATARAAALPRDPGGRPSSLVLDGVGPLLAPQATAALLRAATASNVSVTLSTATPQAATNLTRGTDPAIAVVGTRVVMSVPDAAEAQAATAVALTPRRRDATEPAWAGKAVPDTSRFGFGQALVVDGLGLAQVRIGHVRDSGDPYGRADADPEGPGVLTVREPGAEHARRWREPRGRG